VTLNWARAHGAPLASIGLLLAELCVRAVVGAPYLGATVLLVAACGLALLSYMPGELRSLSVDVALVPALGIASFAALLTTVSILDLPLDEVSIRVAVAALVVPVALVSFRLGAERRGDRAGSRSREALALVALAAIVAFALAASWDIAYPFQPRGTDWGHYLVYSDQVAAQHHLLIDDPFAGEEGRIFADPPAVGAVYGSFLLLDDVSSWSLTSGIVVISALTILSMYAAAAVLWGTGAGLVAAAAYAVAPIRLDPMYWHGLGTTLAIVFVPLVVLSLGLLFRGARGWRHTVFLALALVGVAAAHSTSAILVAALVAAAPLVDALVRLIGGRMGLRAAVRGWWRDGIVLPLAAAVGLACVLGAGVVAHLVLQGRSLGRPVDYRFLGPHWFDRAAVEGYFGVAFLLVSVVTLVLVLTSRRLRHDPALLAFASLALACLAVSQLWRAHIPFEYRRVVYFLGVGLAVLFGAAFVRRKPNAVWIAAFVLVLVYVGRTSVGLRLPERVFRSEPRAPAVSGLVSFRDELDRGALPDSPLLVSDACLHFAVPYLVRRPTIPAFSERQVGFVNRLPLVRQAATILGGGPEGAALARRLGVRYAVADPECAPDLAARLHGTTVLRNDDLVVVQLPPR
jgi:hypothetical protein